MEKYLIILILIIIFYYINKYYIQLEIKNILINMNKATGQVPTQILEPALAPVQLA
jgi:hypothetical protein